MNSPIVRKATVQLLTLLEEGAIDPMALAKSCLGYMSEADVADMASCEGYIEDEDEETEDEDEETEEETES